jgi:hypothetical protein
MRRPQTWRQHRLRSLASKAYPSECGERHELAAQPVLLTVCDDMLRADDER